MTPPVTMRALAGALQDVVTEVESMCSAPITVARAQNGRLHLQICAFMPPVDPLPDLSRAAEVLDLGDGWEKPFWDTGLRRWRYAYSGEWMGRPVTLIAYSEPITEVPGPPANPLWPKAVA